MAFFEDIGKKVSQTSQDAIKKTKILAETTKLNSQISGEKRVISDNYSKIGEKYFELFGDDPDENMACFVTAIKDALAKIEEYEAQIKALKGVASCKSCGAELKEGALFCTACGAKVEETQPEDQPMEQPAPLHLCSTCGNPLPDGAMFCSGCGTKADTQ